MPASFDYAQDKQRGFTLVELLVVISIIAILSVVGITIFTGVQKGARDARRKADIDAVVKALEVNKTSTGNYQAIQASWFTSGSIPQDPMNGSRGPCGDGATDASRHGECWYCVRPNMDISVCDAASKRLDEAPPATFSTEWNICTNLEVGGFYCRKNVQ